MDTKDTDHLQNNADTPALRKYKELFKDSDSDDDFPDIQCDLCSKTFSSVKAYEQHINSKKHHQMATKMKLKKKTGLSNEEEDNNIDPGSDDEFLQCDVCEKTFSGYKPYVAHMKGNIHAKNLKQQKLRESQKGNPEVLVKNGDEVESEDDDLLPKPYAHCAPCDKVFYDPASFKKHMIGSAHKKKMVQQRTLDKLKNELQGDAQIEDKEFFSKCDVCSKQFSGPIPFNTHLMSGVHKNQVKRVQAMEKLKEFYQEDSTTGNMVCKECKKLFTDPFAFKLHLDNNSHEKKKVKDQVLEFVAANPEIAAMKSIENISSDDDNEEKVEYERGSYFLVCKLCHFSFSGLESARDHVLSKKHIKVKNEKKKLKLLKSKMNGIREKKSDKDAVNGLNDNIKSTTTSPSSPEIYNQATDGNDDFELV